MKSLIIIAMFGSCGLIPTSGKVVIQNKSGAIVDSVVVQLNNYQVTTPLIENDQKFELKFIKDSVKASHDVVYSIRIHAQNRVVTRHSFINDLGHIPDLVTFTINDSLMLETP